MVSKIQGEREKEQERERDRGKVLSECRPNELYKGTEVTNKLQQLKNRCFSGAVEEFVLLSFQCSALDCGKADWKGN